MRNGQNDIVGLMDNSGAVVVSYSYDAWGKSLTVSGTLATTLGANNPFRYRGYYYDTETGLYYLQTRYYDATVCRFISADTYFTTDQGITGSNMYAYCGNNPIARVDEGGEFWNILVGAVAGALIGGGIKVVSNLIDGKTWSEGLGTAMLAGAASGALAATGVGLVGTFVGNAAISMAQNATDQVVKNNGFNGFDSGSMLLDGLAGGVAGLIGGRGMGKAVNLTTLNKNLTKKIVWGGVETVKKAVKYYVSQTSKSYLNYLAKPILNSAAASAAYNLAKIGIKKVMGR